MKLYDRLNFEIQQSKEDFRFNNIRNLESKQDVKLTINNEEFYNLCSNNYLGYASDLEVINQAKIGLDKYGVGPGAVRSISGTYDVHIEFEKKLAKFKGVEEVMVVQSGFVANTSLIPTITRDCDLIISDELNHASIIDAMRLSKAKKAIYKHNDMQHLLAIVKQNVAQIEGNIFIVTDGVFSMDGDIAHLDKINDIAKEYGCYTIVDDAHGEGVLGENGRGIVSHFNLENQIDIEIGTLSKAFGLVGGFIGGKSSLIQFLKQKARPFLFSSSLEQSICHAGIYVVEQMISNDTRIKNLWSNSHYLQQKFIADGYSIGNTKTPITPFMVYDESIATKMTEILFEKKILVSPIIYPTVAKSQARIRLMVNSMYTKQELDYLYEEIINSYKELTDA